MVTRISALLCALLCGCALEVVRSPAALAPVSAPARFILAERAEFRLDSGYPRAIAAGTRLVEAGTIAQGRVLRPIPNSLTVEGRHMHEAYLVERSGRLVGFYLPVEQAFSPQSNSIPLSLKGDSAK
jgi:hypothetical protein